MRQVVGSGHELLREPVSRNQQREQEDVDVDPRGRENAAQFPQGQPEDRDGEQNEEILHGENKKRVPGIRRGLEAVSPSGHDRRFPVQSVGPPQDQLQSDGQAEHAPEVRSRARRHREHHDQSHQQGKQTHAQGEPETTQRMTVGDPVV